MQAVRIFVLLGTLTAWGFAGSVNLKVYNTGVNNDGTLAQIGSVDQHYTSADSKVYVTSPNFQWAFTSAARFVAPDPNEGNDYLGTGGVYDQVYSLPLDLTNVDPKSVEVTGLWSTDDTGVILVNGVESGHLSSTFSAFTAFKLSGSSGLFRSGVNTLQFKWHNADGPGGLAVQFESATGESVTPGSGGATLSISAGGVVNSASSVPNAAVAPGSLASVYGVFPMGAAASATVPLPRKLGGLSLKFGVAEAPLAFASASQANVQVPWEVAGQQQVPVSAAFGTQTSAVQNVKLATYAPGIFMMNAKGQGAVVDAFTGQVLTALQPAVAGTSAISIYCTGLGPVTNQPGTGEAASATTLSGTIVPPTVTIGAVPAEVLFSGLAPGFVGLYQINARVPIGAPAGEAVPLVVSIGGAASNAVTIGVRQ